MKQTNPTTSLLTPTWQLNRMMAEINQKWQRKRACLWIAILCLSAVFKSSAASSLLLDVQLYNSNPYSGAAVLGSAGDYWNKFNSLGAGGLSQDLGVDSVPLLAVDGVTYPYPSITFTLTDASADTTVVQNKNSEAGSLGDFWYAGFGAGPGNVDFFGTFNNLTPYNGFSYTLTVYATSGTSTVTGGTVAGSGSFGAVPYQTFTGTITGGQIDFDVDNASTDYVAIDGAQLQITLPAGLTILGQPTNVTVAAGYTATFSTYIVGGSAANTYQWYQNGSPLPGATNMVLTLTGVPMSHNGYTYYLKANDGTNTFTSSTATLSVVPLQNVLLNVQCYSANGYSGAAVLGSAGDYWNKYNTIGAQYGASTNLSVNNARLLGSDGTINTGAGATFTLTDGSADPSVAQNQNVESGPLGDFWYCGFGSGAGNVDFFGTFSNLAAFNGDTYTVEVYSVSGTVTVTGGTSTGSGSFGSVPYQSFTGTITGGQVDFDVDAASTSWVAISGVQLQISLPTNQQPPLLFVTKPANQTIFAGNTATFSASVFGGTGDYTYQWYQNGTLFAGATNSLLSLTNVPFANNGYTYYVRVNSGTNSLTSSTATLTVFSLSSGQGGRDRVGKAVVAYRPAAYYRLDEAYPGTTTVYDYMGVYNGVYGSDSVWGVPGPRLPAQPGFYYTNTAVQVTVYDTNSDPVLPPLNIATNTLTIVAWVNPDGQQSPWAAIAYYNDGTPAQNTALGLEIQGYHTNYNALGYQWHAQGWQADTGLIIPANQWSFVAVVVTPTNATLYAGTNLTLSSYTDVRTEPVQDLSVCNGFIGFSAYVGDIPNRTFNGKIDDVAFFDHALSAQQIAGIFAAGNGSDNLQWSVAGSSLTLTWLSGSLLQADSLAGPWTPATGITSGVPISTTAAHRFYRIQY